MFSLVTYINTINYVTIRKEKEDHIIKIKCQIIWSREWVDLENRNTQPTQEAVNFYSSIECRRAY